MSDVIWAHLHLNRLNSARSAGLDPAGEDVISVKVPGQRIAYVSSIELADVEFKVSEAGRQRCIREGVRNVHAWVVGPYALASEHEPFDWSSARRAVYCPFKAGHFVDLETLEPVHTARRARLVGDKVWYLS